MHPPTIGPAVATKTAGDPAWVGVTGLQCELRSLFATTPTHRALRAALRRVAESLGARYAVVHARFGAQPFSEEWVRQGSQVDDTVRDAVNGVMWEAISDGSPKCVRGRANGAAVAAAVMYDQDVEQTGAAAIVFPDEGRDEALRVLAQFESILGFIAVLVTGRAERRRAAPRWSSGDATETVSSGARHPVRLAFDVAADLKNRHAFDLTAIGYVRGRRVDVVAVCGLDDVRSSNPGARQIRAAMEECLDRREPVFCDPPGQRSESLDDEHERHNHLHRQWSQAIGGKSVASFPLMDRDEVVAVVSVSHGAGSDIGRSQIVEIAESPDMALYGTLVPLSRAASRGLLVHARDHARDLWSRLTGRSRRRGLVLGALAAMLFAWLWIGTLPYGFAVPCAVKAANRRIVSCPRDGVLVDLYVKPGDIVRQGQLLAALDAHDDVLRRLEIEAQIHALDAEADAALAERDFARIRVLEARKATLRAQLAVVEAAIVQAEIRAPQASVVLNGDLREQLGSRVTRGDAMFELARYDRMVVVLKIPESRVLDARDPVSVTFAPTASPDRRVELQELAIAPASTVEDGKNVFQADAVADVTIEGLAPGMEGVAHIDTGSRPTWWVLSHRVVGWLRLNFWL